MDRGNRGTTLLGHPRVPVAPAIVAARVPPNGGVGTRVALSVAVAGISVRLTVRFY